MKIAKECLSHMLRKGMRHLWDLSSLRPVLCADAKINSNAQAQSQHPVKWDECDAKIYIYNIYGLSVLRIKLVLKRSKTTPKLTAGEGAPPQLVLKRAR